MPPVTVSFAPLSAEINEAARSALDAMAKSVVQRGVKQIDLRAYAGGDPSDARKVALARALSVRSYLIDQGVKARIEVGAFAAPGRAAANERVDIVMP
jgi:outer membrane protein OmpA-like peptidoglycan-associated protein